MSLWVGIRNGLILSVILWALIALIAVGIARATVVYRADYSVPSSDLVMRENCPAERSALNWLCYSPANVWTSNGLLHLRQTAGGERRYLAGEAGTFRMGYGWPARDVRQSWAPPVRIEARIKFSAADGLWQAFTAWTTNLSTVTEFDIAEMRGHKETYMLCAIHYNHNERKVHLGRSLPFNITTAFHTYWIDYHRDWVAFGVDNLPCGRTTLTGDAGRIGIDFVAKSADPSFLPWAGGAVVGTPSYAVDWVRAIR